MRRFTQKFLVPYITLSKYNNLCEIGSQGGSNIDRLLQISSIKITIIDPCVDADLESKYKDSQRIHVKKGLSLDVLPELTDKFDCIMIDADHNWYSVYHELAIIQKKNLLAKNGTIFLHDVCWPYARRDMYYDLSTVPVEFQQPSAKKGILRGVSELSDDPSLGKNASLWNAIHEGGERNGVLTAVEDFLRDYPDIYDFISINREWGLGVLVRKGEKPQGLPNLKFKAFIYNTLGAIKMSFNRATGRLDYLPQ